MAFLSVAVLHFQVFQKVLTLLLSPVVAPTEYLSMFCWHLRPSLCGSDQEAFDHFASTWTQPPCFGLKIQSRIGQRSWALMPVVRIRSPPSRLPLVEAKRQSARFWLESLWPGDRALVGWIENWKPWLACLLSALSVSTLQWDVGLWGAVGFARALGSPSAMHTVDVPSNAFAI